MCNYRSWNYLWAVVGALFCAGVESVNAERGIILRLFVVVNNGCDSPIVDACYVATPAGNPIFTAGCDDEISPFTMGYLWVDQTINPLTAPHTGTIELTMGGCSKSLAYNFPAPTTCDMTYIIEAIVNRDQDGDLCGCNINYTMRTTVGACDAGVNPAEVNVTVNSSTPVLVQAQFDMGAAPDSLTNNFVYDAAEIASQRFVVAGNDGGAVVDGMSAIGQRFNPAAVAALANPLDISVVTETPNWSVEIPVGGSFGGYQRNAEVSLPVTNYAGLVSVFRSIEAICVTVYAVYYARKLLREGVA